jgi:hypothetical protein
MCSAAHADRLDDRETVRSQQAARAAEEALRARNDAVVRLTAAKRAKALGDQVSAWRLAQDIHNFCDAIEARLHLLDPVTDDSDLPASGVGRLG